MEYDSAAEKIRIEQYLANFNKIAEMAEGRCKLVRRLIELDEKIINISANVKDITSQVYSLEEMAKILRVDMSNYETFVGKLDFEMNLSDINKIVYENKNRLKKLKIYQLEQYNAKVDFVNNKIDELKKLTNLDSEVVEMIDKLTKLEKYEKRVTDWRFKQYLDFIDYNKVTETNRLIKQINEKLNVKEDKNENLEELVQHIEKSVSDIEKDIKEDMNEETIKKLKDDLEIVESTLVNSFRIKLENNRKNLTDEEYNGYLDRINSVEDKINELNTKLSKNNEYSNDYNELLSKIDAINEKVDTLVEDIETFRSHINESGVNLYESRLSTLEVRLKEFKEELKNKEDKLNDDQKKNLNDKIEEIEKKLSDSKDNLKDPGMIQDNDIFASFNSGKYGIDNLEKKIDELQQRVSELSKPIDRITRRELDKVFKELEHEIKWLEKTINNYKDKEPEKYESTMERFNEVKDKLENVHSEYRKNCPLCVKVVKDGKHVLKKHKKKALIAAGLASFALISHQVLIPAIMHGNIMLGFTTPALRGFATFANKVLAGIVGATIDGYGAVCLANGVTINPSVAATSLLKGLAISGISSTVLVAPVIMAIKKLCKKMELKKAVVENFEKSATFVKNTAKKTVSSVTDTAKKVKNSTAEIIESKKAKKDLEQLFKKYCKSSDKYDSLEDFCKDEGLTEDDLKILKIKEQKKQLDELRQQLNEQEKEALKTKGRG